MSSKPTNPKDRMGIAKIPVSVIPGPVLAELGAALFEGARKYGRHNWRVAEALASVYYDATFRHLIAWYEGEDDDPDSGLSHITKAIASLTVLRDAMIQKKWIDDRPPPTETGWLAELNKKAADIIKRYPDCVEPWTATRIAEDMGVHCNVKKCKNLVVEIGQHCWQHTCCLVGCETVVHLSDPLCSIHEMVQCAEKDCEDPTIASAKYCDYHQRVPKFICPVPMCNASTLYENSKCTLHTEEPF